MCIRDSDGGVEHRASVGTRGGAKADLAEHLANPLVVAAVVGGIEGEQARVCLLYTSPSPRDRTRSRMPSSA